ncbi:MAG: S-layer homology domain-containing protein [Paenibacillaceae bacterium]
MIKRMMKVSIILLAILMLIPIMVSAEEIPSFNDVSDTYWANDAINSLVQLGVINGFEDNTFKPQSSVTREQFAQLITLSFYLDIPTHDTPAFRDVSKTRWSYPAIEAAQDFLTGYYPPNGAAFFDPTGKATREDVAVALVKTLGYQPDDLQDEYILDSFYDSDDISPNIRTYLALAIEKKLLAGYEDRTIKPNNPVTRAEAASLLYRVMKGASSDSQNSLTLNVDAPETTSTSTFYISGDVTKGAQVFINNQEVEVVQGTFRVATLLEEEGTYTYTISARMPGGKARIVTKEVKFEKGAPELTVKGIPEVSDKQMITVTWTVKDDNDDYPVIYINDEQIEFYSYVTIKLEEGDNVVKVRAENKFGKSTEVIKHVLFQTGGPILTVDDIPQTTDKEMLTIGWTVQDKNDNEPKVYVNNELISYQTSTTVKLIEGSNTIVVKAVNKLGKSTLISKEITFISEGPVLTVSPIPTQTTKKSVVISWSVSDKNDKFPIVYINGNTEYNNNPTVYLNKGENTILIKATNHLGQVVEKTFNIIFEPTAPILTLGYAPLTTQSSSINLTWTVSDENDPFTKVYVNDQIFYGSTVVNLTPGVNTFKIVASNMYGKSSEVTYTVTYTTNP